MIKKKVNINKKLKRSIKKISYKLKKHKVFPVIIIALIFFLIGIKIAYEKYIDNPSNIINTIYFDKYILENKQLSGLILSIQETFSGANSAKNKIFNYKTEKNKILSKYKFLNSLNIKLIDNKSIKIELIFKKPKLNFIGSGNIYGVYNENLVKEFDIKNISGLNLLYSGVINLYLPKYLYGEKIDSNIFFKTKLEKIIKYTKNIQDIFPNAKLYYISGGEYIAVKTKDKTYFFSLKKDLVKQIDQLKLIKQRLASKFQNAKVIDIGSLNNEIYLKTNPLGK